MKNLVFLLAAILFFNPQIYSQNSESEPNNIYSEANVLPLNESITGQLEASSDNEDWYKVTTLKDGGLTLVGKPASTLDLYFYLYDTNGTYYIKGSNDQGTGEDETLVYDNLKAGTYYIRIMQTGGTSGSYTLENDFAATAIPDGNDSEPNDTYEQALTLTVDNSATGHLGFYGSQTTDNADWYKITTSKDGALTFVGIPESTLDVFLYLYDTEGSYYMRASNVYGIGENDTLVFNNLKAGTYSLKIYQTGNTYGSYTLENDFVATAIPDGNDSEPNDTYEQALTLTVDNSATGHLGFYGSQTTDNVDWYKITTSTNDILAIVGIPETSLDIYLYLYGADGNTYIASNNSHGVGVNDTIVYNDLEAGTYYIKIDQTGNTYGSYTLKTYTEGSEGGAIISTTSGGNWSETSTWIGGIVPTATDNVTIDGVVTIDARGATIECKDFTINSGKTLNHDSWASTLIVHGNMTNNGTEDAYNVKFEIKGDLYLNGYTKGDFKLNGTENQEIRYISTDGYNFPITLESELIGDSYQWYRDNSIIENNNGRSIVLTLSGSVETADYKCVVDGVDSRIIKSRWGAVSDEIAILTENFDGSVFPPSGWSQTITNSSTTWIKANSTTFPFSDIDPTNVYSALCDYIAEDQDEWLKSPAFSLSEGIFSLEFYAMFDPYWLSNATLKLNISIDGGTNWTKIWEASDDGLEQAWRLISLDLSSYANNANVMLGWQYVGNDGNWVGIDNVNLVSGTIGIDDIPLSELKFTSSNYPNPFALQTTISLQLETRSDIELIIYNSLGQKIEKLFHGNLDAGNHRFNFNAQGLDSGVYYYRFIVDGISVTKPLLLSN